MKKIKKIKIKINGKLTSINENIDLLSLTKIFKIPIKKVAIELNQEIIDKKKKVKINLKIETLINDLKIPIKKVAIELNQEILDKKKLKKIKLKKNDKIEIVHFIGGG